MVCLRMLVAALLTVPTSVPALAQKSISLGAIPPARPNGLASYVHAHQKWASRRRGDDDAFDMRMKKLAALGEELKAESQLGDAFFTTEVAVGTPGQKLPMILDTASADFWVYWTESDFSDLEIGQERPKVYDPSESSTANILDGPEWSVYYADGNQARGSVALDTITLTTALQFPNSSVQIANTTSFHLTTSNITGLFGMARALPSTIRGWNARTVHSQITSALPLDARFLGIDLKANSSEGAYIFGAVDPRAYEGNITWFEGQEPGVYWTVSVTGIKVGGGSNFTKSGGGGDRTSKQRFDPVAAVVDTGTTLIFLPGAVASAYWVDVPGAQLDGTFDSWIFPCSGAEELPAFTVEIGGDGGFEAVVPGKYMNYGEIDSDILRRFGSGGQGCDETMCLGGLQSSGGLEVAILGDVLIKSLFVVLGLEDGKIGFARKKLDLD